jgi:hypothetical protein
MLRSIRNFIITLAAASVIFGYAAHFTSDILIECLGPMFGIVADVSENKKPEQNNKPEQNDPTDEPIVTSTKFSILIINTNYRPSSSEEFSQYDIERYPFNEKKVEFDPETLKFTQIEATDFLLLRGDSAKNEYTYTYLPACMMLNVRGKQLSLNEIYRDFGVTFLSEKLRAATGFNIDYYSVYDKEDIAYVIDYIGGVSCNIPVDIKFNDEVVIKKGNRTINGADMQLILDFNDYQSSTQRGQNYVGIVKKIMSKITNKVNNIDILSLHRSSSKKVDTSITITDINSLVEMLYTYNTGNAHELSYPGNYRKSEGKTYFTPNMAAAISKFSKYR